jgi:molybdopterin-guanine dinucleotide biosynthesis protein A
MTPSFPATHGQPELSQTGLAALVLCGGGSRRMGSPKYLLTLNGETLLQRICRIVSEAASPVVVAGAAEQDLSCVPAGFPIVRDQVKEQGPLKGIAEGLRFLTETQPESTVVFVSSCDCPFLTASVVRFLLRHLSGADEAVVVREDRQCHPLCAVYRIAPALLAAQKLLSSGNCRAQDLPMSLATRWLPLEDLLPVDPALDCLRTCNTPEEFAELCARHTPRDAASRNPPA